jgi:hypothetical protein
MAQSLEKSDLTQQELAFLEHFAFSGNKRTSLEKAGYGTALSKDQVYHRATHILRKAQKCQDWQHVLSAHELSYDDLAAKLKALLNCGNPTVEVNVLKLILQTTDLLRDQPEPPGPGATFHFHLQPQQSEPEKNVTPQPFLIPSSK